MYFGEYLQMLYMNTPLAQVCFNTKAIRADLFSFIEFALKVKKREHCSTLSKVNATEDENIHLQVLPAQWGSIVIWLHFAWVWLGETEMNTQAAEDTFPSQSRENYH